MVICIDYWQEDAGWNVLWTFLVTVMTPNWLSLRWHSSTGYLFVTVRFCFHCGLFMPLLCRVIRPAMLIQSVSRWTFIVSEAIKITSRTTEVEKKWKSCWSGKEMEKLLEQNGFQLMPERVDGWCWDSVALTVHWDHGGSNRKGSASNS